MRCQNGQAEAPLRDSHLVIGSSKIKTFHRRDAEFAENFFGKGDDSTVLMVLPRFSASICGKEFEFDFR